MTVGAAPPTCFKRTSRATPRHAGGRGRGSRVHLRAGDRDGARFRAGGQRRKAVRASGARVVVQIHQPIPAETLDFAISRNVVWEGALQAFEGARISSSALSPTNDPRSMRADAERVTCATAALCELAPFDLWVAVHFFPGRDFETTQQIFARTTGLLPFIGREIECGPYAKEPSELGPIVRAVGYYVLDRRVEFQGGEFIGTEDDPIGRIDLARTAVGVDNIAVYRIVLGETENG